MPTRPTLTPGDVDAAYAAAQRVVETHQRVADFLRAGQTLYQIDAFVAKTLQDLKCKSCFLDYKPYRSKPPFPSHACLSVNECVVHGPASYYEKPMQPGDLLKIDIGVKHQGWIGDAAWTYVFGTPSPQVRKLMDCGKESLRRAIPELHPSKLYMAWAQTLQKYVEQDCGFHLIRKMGGHGYHRYQLHAGPFISNVPLTRINWPEGEEPCQPGICIAVEPMIAIGTGEIREDDRKWPVYTADGSLSVHYEHDILITESGPRVLTEGLDQLPDVIG